MRRIFYVLTQTLCYSKEEPSYLLGRGLQYGKCYLLPGIQRCNHRKSKVECILHIYPDSEGELRFFVPNDRSIPPGKSTEIYGRFLFQFLPNHGLPGPRAEVKKIEKFSLEQWVELDFGDLMAKLVDCESN
jgi:hypothetical protein